MPITRRRWTAAEDELVRTLLPDEAAARTGRTVAAVHQRRWLLSVADEHRSWTEAEDRLLAKLPTEQAARYLRRSPMAMKLRRRKLGLVERA
jgi:hypothetical protein